MKLEVTYKCFPIKPTVGYKSWKARMTYIKRNKLLGLSKSVRMTKKETKAHYEWVEEGAEGKSHDLF